jgi:hypothetical protein
VGVLSGFFNILTKAVISEILSEAKLEKRRTALIYAISLGHELYNLNNFHAFLAVYCGITDSAIRRLSKTWVNIPPKIVDKLEACHVAASLSGNYGFMVQRIEELREQNEALIPYLGIIQRDILMIVEKKQLENKEALLNSQYDLMIKSVNERPRMAAVTPLNFILRLFPQLWCIMDDDELSEVSNAYEPRVRGESLSRDKLTPEAPLPRDSLLKSEGKKSSSKEIMRKGSKDNVKNNNMPRKNSAQYGRFEKSPSQSAESTPKKKDSQLAFQLQRNLMKSTKNKRNKYYQKIIFASLSVDLRQLILKSGYDLKIVSESQNPPDSKLFTSMIILQLRYVLLFESISC